MNKKPLETIFKDQWYLMPDGTFARVLAALETLEYITVSLHKSPLDEILLLDGSNTEEFYRSQVKQWRLWDSVKCKSF
ncbi:hypothetical protein UFOVP607_43 [uncultured Caudovirales phage]|uniref:Uncharacterized protein n=1 Tax=uncultured Caudovirales phage TaxID=2100421 RepID=A0A6J5N2T4_9CAUD|nr:hypothetical protein UFOVP607_43 [uncultured Caudovirales phage]